MTTQPIPNRTSLFPYYTFADTLAEQEAQLNTNLLMQRLIEKLVQALDTGQPTRVPTRVALTGMEMIGKPYVNLHNYLNSCCAPCLAHPK